MILCDLVRICLAGLRIQHHDTVGKQCRIASGPSHIHDLSKDLEIKVPVIDACILMPLEIFLPSII